MTFLGANTTGACEDTWVGAIRLGMTVDLVNRIYVRDSSKTKDTYPGWPQLKQFPLDLRGSGHSRAKWPD